MSVIDIAVAMQHTYAVEADQPMVQACLDAAEEVAQQWMGRTIYADQGSLAAAVATVPDARADARSNYETAIDAARQLDDADAQADAERDAENALRNELSAIDAIANGIVLNAAITAACLLIAGHYYANREQVVVGTITAELPMGATALLAPYRIYRV